MKIIEIRANGTKRVATVNTEPAKTDPSYLKETDVNHIIQKFTKTGQITHITRKKGSFADVSNATDLLTALQTIQHSKNMWSQLPEKIQDRFGTPQKLLKFLNNPDNMEEAAKLGLLTIREESGTIQNESSADKRKRVSSNEESPEEQGVVQEARPRSPRVNEPSRGKTPQQGQ